MAPKMSTVFQKSSKTTKKWKMVILLTHVLRTKTHVFVLMKGSMYFSGVGNDKYDVSCVQLRSKVLNKWIQKCMSVSIPWWVETAVLQRIERNI